MNSFYQPNPQVISQSPAEHLKKYLQKPIIMAVGAIAIVMALLSVASNILTSFFSSSYTSYSSSFSQNLAAQNAVTQYISIAFTVITCLLYSVPFIVMNIQAKRGSNPTAAVTVLQVISVILLVFYSLFLLLYTAIFVLFSIGLSFRNGFISSSAYFTMSGDISSLPTGIAIVIFAIVELILIVMLFYPIALVRLSFSVKGILNGKTAKVNGATAAGVYNVIFCILACISTLLILIVFLATLTEGTNIIRITVNDAVLSGADAAIYLGVTSITLIVAIVGFIIKARACFGLKRHMNAFAAFGNMGSNNSNQYGGAQQSPNQYGDQYNNPMGGYQQNDGYQGNPYDNNPYGGNQN